MRSWRVEAEAPPSFQTDVWRKIATRHATAEKPLPVAGWIGWFLGRLGQPRYAVPVGLALLAVSLGLARVQADAANGRTWRTLETRYVVSIDPMAMVQGK